MQEGFGLRGEQRVQRSMELNQLTAGFGTQSHLGTEQAVEIPLTAADNPGQSGYADLAMVLFNKCKALAQKRVTMIAAAALCGRQTKKGGVALSEIRAGAQCTEKRRTA